MSNDLISAQLGNYRIQRLLGRGGFAEVYLAEHIFLKTPAAIKVLHTSQQDTRDFLQEARLLASLKHPHIVPILEFDLYEGRPFLVMEYMPYGTLRQRYPRGSRLSIETIIASIQQMTSALHYLHERGLAHGDVKPENMLIGAEDRLHLSDFGIAILANKEQEQALVGSIEYMAPEQLQHQLVPASDQYALGITAYEWLAGVPPFTGSYIEVATQHALTPPPSLREHIANLPAQIDVVIMRALAKEPEQRFASVSDFARALENTYLGTLPPLLREPLPATQAVPTTFSPQTEQSLPPTFGASKPSRRSLLLAGGAGAVALGLVGTGGFFWWKSTQGGTSASAATPTAANSSTPQQSVSKQGTTYFIYTKQTAPISALAWSPDGKRIASASSAAYYIPGNSNSREHSIHAWDALTGDNPVIYQGHKDSINAVAWSPDGKYIASGGAGSPPLHVWETSTGKRVAAFTRDTAAVTQVYWQSNNQILFAAGENELVTSWHPFASSNWTRVFNGQAIGETSECIVSPDGQYVLAINNTAVYRVTNLQKLGSNGDYLALNAPNIFNYWAPNSQQLATTPYERSPEVWDVVTGRVIAQFTKDDKVLSLGWSPDSKYIASWGQNGSVFIWNATNGNELYRYPPRAQSATSIAWSPNGQMIASGGIQGSIEVWQGM